MYVFCSSIRFMNAPLMIIYILIELKCEIEKSSKIISYMLLSVYMYIHVIS